MHTIRALLWDVDGTLLDFGASERAGIRQTFASFGLGPCTDEMLADYDRINNKYWEMLERRECTKRQTMVWRFVEFFERYGLTADVEAFNDEYQRRLPDTIVFRPNAWETLTALNRVRPRRSWRNTRRAFAARSPLGPTAVTLRTAT